MKCYISTGTKEQSTGSCHGCCAVREDSGQDRDAGGGRKEAALAGSSSILLPAGGRDWSVTLPRQHILHGCQIYSFWQQSNAFMSHLSSYHFFQFSYHQHETTDFVLLLFNSCLCCLFPDCHMSIMHALINCCPVAGSVPLPPTRSTGWAPSSSASSPSSPRRTAGRFRCWITCDGMKDNLCLCAVQPTQYQCMIRSCQRQSSA